jgi:hypothetical protein
MSRDGVTRTPLNLTFYNGRIKGAKIINSSALFAANMVMTGGIAIKTKRGATALDLVDFSCLRKSIKISVDGSETYFGKTEPYHGIDLIRCGMTAYLAKFFKDNSPLLRHSTVYTHARSLLIIVTIISSVFTHVKRHFNFYCTLPIKAPRLIISAL